MFFLWIIPDFECILCVQFMVLSGVVAMVTCAVFLRLSCVLKLTVILLAAVVYTYLMETHR